MATHYTQNHEWLAIKEDIATVGITDHAQDALGEIVYVELPKLGTVCNQGDAIAMVESVKAASDIYTPVSGEIVARNHELDDSPVPPRLKAAI